MTISRQQRRKGNEDFERIRRYYEIPTVSNARKLFLYVSDTFNDWLIYTGKNDFDEIVPGLYLGRIPTKEGFKLPNDIGLVVSTVSNQEIAGLGMTKTPYTPKDWEDLGVKHHYLNILDLTADVSTDDLRQAAKVIKDFFDDCNEHPEIKKNKVYVHCKAGRSRSAMLVATYLARYGHYPFELTGVPHTDVNNAIIYIKSKRPQIDVGPNKTAEASRAVSSAFFPERKIRQPECDYSDLYSYLGSLYAKDEIRKFTTFKELARYATAIQSLYKSPQRTEHVRDFFNDILFSRDGKWYDRLINRESAIGKLLDANKGDSEYGKNDRDVRQQLVDNFINELNQHLVSKNLLSLSYSKTLQV